MRFYTRVLFVLVQMLSYGCSPGSVPNAERAKGFTFTLDYVRQYGAASEALDTLPAALRRFDGPVIGRAVSAAEGPDGSVYVLDPFYKKILRFDRTGNLIRVILGGHGEGPGEFISPRDVTVDPRGVVYVTDPRLNRITRFADDTLAGTVTITEAPIHRVAVLGDTMWINYGYSRTARYVNKVFAPNGEYLRDGFPVRGAMGVFAEAGEPGVLGKSLFDEVLFALNPPGRWARYSEGRIMTLGTEVDPTLEPLFTSNQYGPIAFAPAGARGIGRLPDSTVVLMYMLQDVHESGVAGGRMFLEFFAPTGSRLGRLELDTLVHTTRELLLVSSLSNRVLISSSSPYPRLIEYSVNRQEVPRDE